MPVGDGLSPAEPDVHVRGQRGGQVEGLPHDSGQLDGLERDRQPARLNARDVQHLVDQSEEVASPGEDVRHALLLLGVEGVHLQELRETQDGVKGSPELVAHPGQELALGLTRPVGLSSPQERLLNTLPLGDVLDRAFQVGDPARGIVDHPSAGPRPDNRPIGPAQLALVAAHDAFPLQCGDPPPSHLGIDIQIGGVPRPQGLQVRTAQHPKEGGVGFQRLAARGGAEEAYRNAVEQTAVACLALAEGLFGPLPLGDILSDNQRRPAAAVRQRVGRDVDVDDPPVPAPMPPLPG